MLHPDSRITWISDEVGYGMVATRPIPKGTVVWARDPLDRVFSPEEEATLAPPVLANLRRYAYILPCGSNLLCWDFGRFMNHSCEANCLSTGWEVDVAVADIAVGDELTADYGYLNMTEPFECACGHDGCRGRVSPADFEAHAAKWDARIQAVFPRVTAVPQPLWPLLTHPELVEAAAADPTLVPSVLAHRLLPGVHRGDETLSKSGR